MGKSFAQTLAEMYKPKAKSEQDFVDKHVVATKADAAGNGDDVFKAANIKKDKSKKDPTPEEQEKMYESEVDEDIIPPEAPKVQQKKVFKRVKHTTEDVKEKYSNSWRTALLSISESRLDEAVKVTSNVYQGKRFVSVQDGSHVSYPLHQEELEKIEKLAPGKSVSFKDETKSIVTATRSSDGNNVTLRKKDENRKTTVKYTSLTEDLSESHDDGVASDLDREIIEAMLRSASFKLDFVYALVEDEEIEIPLYMKHTVSELKVHIDAMYSEVNVLLSQYEDAEEHVGAFMEQVELLDESIQDLEEANFPSKGRKWSEHVKYSIDNNTAAKPNKIAKGKDFDVYIRYGGSIKRTPHYVIRDDVIIGGGYTLPSALKDAGLKPKDVTVFSKYPEGSRLNTMKEKEDLEELSKNKLRDYVVKSGDHADKLNKEINTSKGDARVANIQKNMPTIKKRNAGSDLAYKKLGTGNNSYSPNAKVSGTGTLKREDVEDVGYLDEAIKSVSKKAALKRTKDGDWEAMTDIKTDGSHTEFRNTRTNKRFMVQVNEDTDLDEAKRQYGTDPESVRIKAEHDDLRKLPMKKLRAIIQSNSRVSTDSYEFISKDHIVTKILRDKHGDKRFAKAMGISEDKDPCWKGYKMLGTKKKNNKDVPNCVSEDYALVEELIDSLSEDNKKKAKELAKTEEGLKKLLDFIKKNEME
jgi:hypothetical protein